MGKANKKYYEDHSLYNFFNMVNIICVAYYENNVTYVKIQTMASMNYFIAQYF
jgi:hypothetical protein